MRAWPITHLSGTLLARVQPHPPALLRDLGRLLGEIDLRLRDLDHPGMHRELDGDLRRAVAVIGSSLETIPSEPRRGLVLDALEHF